MNILMTVFYRTVDVLAWINSNMVGIFGVILAIYAAKKTFGYFEKKHIEETRKIIADTYVVAKKSTDTLFTVLNMCDSDPTFSRNSIKLLAENSTMWAKVIEDRTADLLRILKNNESVFMSLYDNQINVRLFLREEKYIISLRELMELHNKIRSLISGVHTFAKNLKSDDSDSFNQIFIDLIDKAFVQLSNSMELNENQKEEERKWEANKAESGGIKKFKWFLEALNKIQKNLEIYPEWLDTNLKIYKTKK